jgi:hypothetical protein
VKHPIFHVDEPCYALVQTSSGIQRMECDITGARTRRMVRDLDGKQLGYAECYKVLFDGATMETLIAERDLQKKFVPCNDELKKIWRPQPVKASRPQKWKVWK